MTQQHTWVKQVIIPVNVAQLVGDQVVVGIDPDLEQACLQGNAAFGCMACEEPLTTETVNTECTRIMTEEEIQRLQMP